MSRYTDELIKKGLDACKTSVACRPGLLTSHQEISLGTIALILNEILKELRKQDADK